MVVDELDQARTSTTALEPLLTFLGGVPVTLDGRRGRRRAEDWRIVATWNGATAARARVLRRFALIDGPRRPPTTSCTRRSSSRRQRRDRDRGRRDAARAQQDRVGAGVLLDAAKPRRAPARPPRPPTRRRSRHELIAAYIAPLIEP